MSLREIWKEGGGGGGLLQITLDKGICPLNSPPPPDTHMIFGVLCF